jgi:hypothetical protein
MSFNYIKPTKPMGYMVPWTNMHVTWVLSPTKPGPEPEVIVDIAGYDKWIPDANVDNETKSGNDLFVSARVCKPNDPKTLSNETATITFILTDVSQEKGLCANWPTHPGESSSKPDLRIVTEKNRDLEEKTKDVKMETKQPVREAKAVISSFDCGAWGTLWVKAMDKDGKRLKVKFRDKEDQGISLPKDEDQNHIADGWQKDNHGAGLPADWDSTEVKGQDNRGDGVTLYQEYRGFVVVSPGGGHQYVRLKPLEKIHFVIDPQGIFDCERWRAASGIRAYKVLAEWTDNDRQVDIHHGFAGGNGKWAVKVENDPAKVDENQSEKALSDLRGQWAMTQCKTGDWKGTPQNVEFCRIFSGRIHYSLRWVRDKMLRCLKAPINQDDRDEAAWLLTLGLSKAALISRLEKMSDASLETLVKPLVAWSAIHEEAHACGVDGHLNDKGEESGDCVPPYVPSCPMQYMIWKDKRKLVLFGQINGQGKLCEQHHCWQQLSPKD